MITWLVLATPRAVMGLTMQWPCRDWLDKLAGIFAFDVCKSVFAGVNGKPLDDPEMLSLFEIKGYP